MITVGTWNEIERDEHRSRGSFFGFKIWFGRSAPERPGKVGRFFRRLFSRDREKELRELQGLRDEIKVKIRVKGGLR